ncbi:hypothetical protein RF11_01823 [Thelohanellus kitauei]|uniref:Uncharacterized protein n=1 Tax=Thelohanellus kitauei TaxID=669202 RepID=A0A0C2IFI4_THEKT|nr:hypothetical protein RF11_01823 [Thelohanellus kitauei]
MKVYYSMQARLVISCLFVLFVVTTRAQKKINVDDSKLNVVVVGDIGVPESESDVKKQEHRTLPFTLGLNLGANVYPRGSIKNDFYTLQTIFTDYFPPHVFEFDFLTIPGPIDYEGDLQTQINYRDYQPRFYMPEKSYFYG